ncbi:MAG: hypothetical protein Q9225_000677 [Loekoesia sp. 1 TL-2023]
MVSTEEGTHFCTDGIKLYTKTWKPTGDPLAKIVFVHGFSDHCNAYLDLFPYLASRKILVHAFDQRGWGRSVSKISERGLTGATPQVLDDINSVLKSQLPSIIPLFLMGHSMGGGEVLLYDQLYAASGPRDMKLQISGYICESPLIAIHEDTEPSKIVVIMGRLASKILPRRQMVQRIEPKFLCRDEELCKEFEADELCHDTGTLEGLAGMLQRTQDLDGGRLPTGDLEGCSLWVGHGTEDRVTSFKATARFMDRIPIKDKTFKIYDGYYHKLHAEPGDDKLIFARDVADWVLARSAVIDKAADTLNEAKSKL